MWGHAINVAIVGFSVVFAGLLMLTVGIKIMGFFCKKITKRQAAKAQPKAS
jgi:Na+-transporting methylmalonyl-CoA/oxaloacetate decarboxylase gamma subunit